MENLKEYRPYHTSFMEVIFHETEISSIVTFQALEDCGDKGTIGDGFLKFLYLKTKIGDSVDYVGQRSKVLTAYAE